MYSFRFLQLAAVAGLLALATNVPTSAQEHPSEHPSEHPTASGEALTIDTLAAAIEQYVAEDSELKGGYFLVYDPVNAEVLPLTLEKIHKDRLSHIGNDVYFACADFSTPQGMVYDLDIFMHGDSAADLEIDSITVHKENGEARYSWVEKDGIWQMAEVR